MFLGVPRIWEKIQEGILAASGQTTGFKKKIAEWAKSIGPEGTFA
jgi:long-chain-fatty-acid--CoA ligase ACSBG